MERTTSNSRSGLMVCSSKPISRLVNTNSYSMLSPNLKRKKDFFAMLRYVVNALRRRVCRGCAYGKGSAGPVPHDQKMGNLIKPYYPRHLLFSNLIII